MQQDCLQAPWLHLQAGHSCALTYVEPDKSLSSKGGAGGALHECTAAKLLIWRVLGVIEELQRRQTSIGCRQPDSSMGYWGCSLHRPRREHTAWLTNPAVRSNSHPSSTATLFHHHPVPSQEDTPERNKLQAASIYAMRLHRTWILASTGSVCLSNFSLIPCTDQAAEK